MAIDSVSACAQAAEQSGPKGFFVALAIVFAGYIFADSVIAAAVIRKKVLWSDER